MTLPLGTSLHALAVNAAAGITPRDGEHVRDTMARELGVTGDLRWRIQVDAPRHGRIIVCPHAKASYKEWPEDHWRQVLDAFPDLLLIPAPGRTLCGREGYQTDVQGLARALAGASLVIAVDSGPIHLADALGVPVLGLYAATSATTYGPYTQRERCIDRHREAHARLLQAYDSARHVVAGEPMRLITADEVIARIHAHA